MDKDIYILNRDGLTLEKLRELSYQSELNISLKRSLRKVSREKLFEDIKNANKWYKKINYTDITIDFRIKSKSSAINKYHRYITDGKPIEKVFNDLIGFRSLINSYDELEELRKIDKVKFVDMSEGKSNDDGYRGIHLYYQMDHGHYPIEIQYNTYYDRALNNWLHFYLYKNEEISNDIGCIMRQEYEQGNIKNEKEFKEVLANVLSNCER